MLGVPEFETAAELREHYAGVKRRMMQAVPERAMPRLERCKPTIGQCILTLAERTEDQNYLTLPEIMTAVSFASGIQPCDIKSSYRGKSHVLARRVYFYIARKYTKLSTTRVAAYCGGLGHSAVMKAQKYMKARPHHYSGLIKAVEAMISVGKNGEYVLTIPSQIRRAEGVLEAPTTALTKSIFSGDQHG